MQWNEPPPASPKPNSPREDTPITLRSVNTCLQGLQRRILRRRAVDGNDDDAVGDDEVHVRGRRDLARGIAIQPDARDAHDVEPAAGGVRGGSRACARSHPASRRWGRRRPAGAWHTTRPGATKRAMLSMWPSVWSFFRPSSIQMTLRAPKAWRSAASASSFDQPLRLGLSSVCRVVRMVPSPS